MSLFWRQFAALCRKNWCARRRGPTDSRLILAAYPITNVVRCLLVPIAYAVFFSKAQLQRIPPDLLGHRLVWVPPANDPAFTLMDTVLAGAGVHGDVVRVPSVDGVAEHCPENFNQLSDCFAAVVFDSVDYERGLLNYTIRGDFGLAMVNVDDISRDDTMSRYLPLQWAIESAFINQTTGTMPDPPLQWGYTTATNKDNTERQRMSYLRGIRGLLVLAFFLGFLPIVYHLPGSIAYERANSLTAHLNAQGCLTSARVFVSAAYLAAWIIMAATYQTQIFKHTNMGLFIVVFVITGLSLASWTFLVAVPFGKAPTLAAVTATFGAILTAIVGQIIGSKAATQLVFALIFPPTFFVFTLKGMASFELAKRALSITRRSPSRDAPILALLIIAIVDIFLFPLIAVWLERRIYDSHSTRKSRWGIFGRKKTAEAEPLPSDVAVRLSHISKTYDTRWYNIGRKKGVVAIEDLSFDVPRGGVFCLLGRNGSAKSTTLNAVARLISLSSGTIEYGVDQHIGVASQKDVLWNELTCVQHVALWRAVKGLDKEQEDDRELLKRCDLEAKTAALSKNLSGGQKRKLQLACAIAGGSNLLLLDEISSGLDPLSRRAIWRLITANRGHATIILTTHFLDEADHLGDTVAILRQPGKLLAIDNPVGLKTKLGRGITVAVDDTADTAFVKQLKASFPAFSVGSVKGKHLFMTGSNDLEPVISLVSSLQAERNRGVDVKYQVGSGSLEEVFLDLNAGDFDPDAQVLSPKTTRLSKTQSKSGTPVVEKDSKLGTPALEKDDIQSSSTEKDIEEGKLATLPIDSGHHTQAVALTPSNHGNWLRATLRGAGTIFLKRLMVLRRSWLLTVIGVILVIGFSCVPLFFMKDRVQTCENEVEVEILQRLSYPQSLYPYRYTPPLLSVGDAVLGNWTNSSLPFVKRVDSNATLVSTITNNIKNQTFGGLSLTALPSTNQLVAFESTPLRMKGLSALNLFSNSVYQQLRPAANAFRINLNFQWIPAPSFASTAQVFKWIGFFGIGIAFWPAFAVVFPTSERSSNVRANQYSNGANPVALWLGHILFEMPLIVFVATIITIVFATAVNQFNALGLVWLCFVLYGVAGSLWAYLFALFLSSPLASWAIVAGLNVLIMLLYLAMYLLILTYDRSVNATDHMTICHFTIALINPTPNIMRAILVSLNVFGLLCDGLGAQTSKPYGDILQFGGPILYLIMQSVVCFCILVWVDSGAPIPALFRRRLKGGTSEGTPEDVIEEKERVERSPSDALVVRALSKKFHGTRKLAVDNVSFGVDSGDTFALLGPNGAGKTTALACIRGVLLPTQGDVMVTQHSITKQRNKARAALGVCPQVNAIDSLLTVRQHLWLYGRLKGVPSKPLRSDIDALLAASGLAPKADELATSLSGGNQRKLLLAIALIGDPPVVLIDEFSSGVDPFSKREAWTTLAALTRDRAVVMTTHSMEEVDALASRIGILASKMLAVGTPAGLKSRYATYEVHVGANHIDSTLAYLHSNGFEGANRSVGTATRISVPGVREDELGELLNVLAGGQLKLGLSEMTLHEASTETAFLAIVREHNIQEEEGASATRVSRWKWLHRD
ncbi:hypothetical protein Q8F55_003646 [Vanrija albida]|uniref:ABC transporter domain-containing protein n=1 Tax=Vanrija albida TaxID=181172 RepID=A0ABR3Q4I0_9TREE